MKELIKYKRYRGSKIKESAKFNNNYIPKIKKTNSIIYKGDFVKDINNNNNDFCVTFKRLKKYVFANGSVGQYWESQKYDCIVALVNNYITLSFQNDLSHNVEELWNPNPQSLIIIIILNYFSIIHFINYSEFKF